MQDGFHDPAAFAAATQQGHSLRRLQQQLAAAANGSSSGGKRPPVDETADKLDSLMEMTFTHLQWRVDAGEFLNLCYVYSVNVVGCLFQVAGLAACLLLSYVAVL
jgi:hypothetical protein